MLHSQVKREYRDCTKSRGDKIGITRHIMMHQVLYNVHVTLFVGQLHNILHLVHHGMLYDPNLVSSTFHTITIFPFLIAFLKFTCLLSFFLLLLVIALDIEHLNTHHYNIPLGVVNIRSRVNIIPWSKTYSTSLFHCMCFDQHLYQYTYMYTYIVG